MGFHLKTRNEFFVINGFEVAGHFGRSGYQMPLISTGGAISRFLPHHKLESTLFHVTKPHEPPYLDSDSANKLGPKPKSKDKIPYRHRLIVKRVSPHCCRFEACEQIVDWKFAFFFWLQLTQTSSIIFTRQWFVHGIIPWRWPNGRMQCSIGVDEPFWFATFTTSMDVWLESGQQQCILEFRYIIATTQRWRGSSSQPKSQSYHITVNLRWRHRYGLQWRNTTQTQSE